MVYYLVFSSAKIKLYAGTVKPYRRKTAGVSTSFFPISYVLEHKRSKFPP